MRSRLIAIAALAALFCSPALAAPTWAPSQGGAAGPVVSCTDLNGNTIRCVQPSVTLNDATGAALGTSGNPLVTSGPSSGSNQVVGNVASGAADSGNPVKQGGVFLTTPPTVTTGQRVDQQMTNRGESLVAISNGAVGAAVQAVSDGMSSTPNGLVTVTYAALASSGGFEVRARDVALAIATGVGTAAVHTVPTSAASVAIAPSATSAVASALVAKAAAGNLYHWTVTAGASAGFVMVFDATSAPADGAVTPKECIGVAANSTVRDGLSDIPERFATGITLVFSTTGCFSKTASATAFIKADAL